MVKENPAIHIAKVLLKQSERSDGRLSSCDIAKACGFTNITIDSLEKKISRVEKNCGIVITPEYTRLGEYGGKTMVHLNVSVDDMVRLQKFAPTVSLRGLIAKEMGASVEEVSRTILDPQPQPKERKEKEDNDSSNKKIKVSLEIEIKDLDRLIKAVEEFASLDSQVLNIWSRKKELEQKLKEAELDLENLLKIS